MDECGSPKRWCNNVSRPWCPTRRYNYASDTMATFALNSPKFFSLSSQLFLKNHATYRSGRKFSVCTWSASSLGSNDKRVTNKSHEQKTSSATKKEMESKHELSISQRSGTAACPGLRAVDSRKMSSSQVQRDGGQK